MGLNFLRGGKRMRKYLAVLLFVLPLLCCNLAIASEWTADANTIALFHFDDLTDCSQNGYTLKLNGNAQLSSENVLWMQQPSGKALKVNGLGDEATVSIEDSKVMPGLTGSPLTLDAWFYPIAYKAYGVNNYQLLSFYQSWDVGFEVRDGKWNSPPVPTVRAGQTSIVAADVWQQAAALNQWHFLRITHAANTVTVYLDGNLISSSATALNFARTNDWVLNLGNFQGYIDEVRISKGVRTDTPPTGPATNLAPTVDAGSDVTIVFGQAVGLNAGVQDDGLVNAVPSVQWSKVSGPGTVVFADGGSPQTTADFSQMGAYVLRITANDGELSASDEMAVTVREPSTQTAQPFSLVILPDTQNYAAYSLAKFKSQTQWIADHAADLNIKMVLHEGDLVLHPDYLTEWTNAQTAMTILDGTAPYVLSVGNHDYGGGRNSTAFNNYFPAIKHQGFAGFGGLLEAEKLDNSYHMFSAGGVDFLVFSLEFGPRNEVLSWADSIIAAHPSHRVIILTHAYLDGDGSRLSSGDPGNPHYYGLTGSVNDGEEMWRALIKKHKNIDFVFSGHVRGVNNTGCANAYTVDIGDNGNLVHQIVANYQDCYNGGSGYLRIITFDPASRSATVKTYSPYLNSWLTDANNQFTIENLPFFAQTQQTNTAPSVDAGADQGAVTGQAVSLSGEVSDDGRPDAVPRIAWSVLSGPGAVQFGNAAAAATSATFAAEGLYVLELKAFDGEFTAADTVLITVKNANSAPDAIEQNVSVDEDASVEILLLATDPDGDAITYEIIRSPQHGVISGGPPVVHYVPAKDYFGTDALTFQAKDSGGRTDTAEVIITINPVNDPPTVADLTVSTAAGAAVVISLAGADVDYDALSYRIVVQPRHGTLRQDGSNWIYTPAVGFSGVDCFTYLASDGQAESATATATIQVGVQSDEFHADTDTVALYHFDDLADSSGNGFHLVLKGAAQLTAEELSWMGHPGGKALKVSGLGDEVSASIPDAMVMPGTADSVLTFEARFYPVAYKAYSINNYQILSFYQAWDVGFEVRDGKWNSPAVPTVRGGNAAIVGADDWRRWVPLNQWHSLKMVHSQSTVSVYIDGQLIGSGTTAFNFGRTNNWTLTLGNFQGYIDEVRISRVVR